MARSAFNAITTWDRLHLRTDSYGPINNTSWPEANGGTAASAVGSGQVLNANILGNGTGPGWELDGQGATTGFATSGVFTAFAVIRADVLTGFQTVFGDQTGDQAGEYFDSTTLFIFSSTVSPAFVLTASTGVLYRLILVRDGSSFRGYVDGTLIQTTGVPGSDLMTFEFGSTDGGSFGLDGDLVCFGVVDEAFTPAQIALLDSAIQGEVAGTGDGVVTGPVVDTGAKLLATGPDHIWPFDGAFNDTVGGANATNSGMGTGGVAIANEQTASVFTNGVTDRATVPDQTTINSSALDRKAFGGWFMTTAVQDPPCRIYGEGNQSNAFHITLGFGNNVIFEAIAISESFQVFSDRVLQNNRPYHLLFTFSGSGFDNEIAAYLDGVKLLDGNPSDREPDITVLPARTGGDNQFGDPSGTVGVGGGGTTVILVAPVNGHYAWWASWSGAGAELTATEIREDLFEAGALPDETISSDTQSAMQTALNAFSDTIRPDAPCCIRIEALDGGGDLTLAANNITFDPLASIHVQYTGTDTLTWRNTNGSDASIASTPNGGTIVFVQSVTVRVTVRDAATLLPVQGARVLLEAAAGGPVAAGTDIILDLTDVNGQVSTSIDYSADQPVTGRARKASASPLYQTGQISGTITADGADLTVFVVRDE